MSKEGHYVAVFGGAVSGAEAAYQLSQNGIRTVVFEQNLLPFGKIEDGLPKWHVKLRDKEEGRIKEKLSHPLVEYVPKSRLGEDIDFEDVAKNWGFTAVILAIGAWRDRPLPVEGADDFVDKGLVYQNPFIYWFNHFHEPDYAGQQYEISDDVIVVGGGLASIDVSKVLMFETVARALKERGIDADLFSLERSIAKVLESHGLTLQDLGLKGCTLYYRRRPMDMPLSPSPTDTPEQLAKAQKVREKILQNAQEKYLFNVRPLHVPVKTIVENGRLTGLVFQETKIDENGRAVAIAGSDKEVRGPMIISSIGSLPEQIPGIPSAGNMYKVNEADTCRVNGYQNVFAIGNAVTGRGNINESLKHGRDLTQEIIEKYLKDPDEIMADAYRDAEKDAAEEVAVVTAEISRFPKLSAAKLSELEAKVRARQDACGYTGDFLAWAEKHTPVRLEEMLGIGH